LNFASTATLTITPAVISMPGLDDLHPRRGEHAAEDDVDDHEDPADEDGRREADPASASISEPAPTSWAVR
jgi:hypothetical protein